MKQRGYIELRRGKYRVRMRIDGRIVSGGTFDVRGDAEKVLAALNLKTSGREALTLAEWGRSWLDRREVLRRLRNSADDRNRWEQVCKQDFAVLPIDLVSRVALMDWVEARLRDGLARQTVVNQLNLVRGAFSEAVSRGKAKTNPAAGIKVPKVPRADDTWTYLSSKEVVSLLTNERLSKMQCCAYTVAIYTGLRAGEMWGLRWADVHLTDRLKIVVRSSYDGPTKAGVVREVPLLPQALTALSEWKRASAALPRALVFGRHHKGYDAEWSKVRGRLGFRDAIRFHDFRHTCASHLIQGTWTPRPLSLEEVQQWLGHQSRVTTERYAHLRPDSIFSLAEQAAPQPLPRSPK